tara:strand:+ start:2413 stop:2931 length:519 start_codon:yes stop_codon:yes gene_type:complete
MDKKFLLAFAEYFRAAHKESIRLKKFNKHFINDPRMELVCYHIFIHGENCYHPTQTELIYDLGLDAQQIGKLVASAIELGFVKQKVDRLDKRIARYQATDRLISGISIHATRHAKALIDMSTKVGFFDQNLNEQLMKGLAAVVDAKFMKFPAYGEGELENILNILEELNVKQ